MKYLVLVLLLVASTCYAEQKYNPHTARWETTSDNSDLEYNNHNGTWSYQDKTSNLEYNPHNAKWEWTGKQEPKSQNLPH